MSLPSFEEKLAEHDLDLSPLGVDTLQVNVTRLCNQACHHCHVDASPKRTEQMSRPIIDRCLEILANRPEITRLDITGGAPELNPHFDYFVEAARQSGKHVMVRHNLTVTIDGNPQTGESKRYLPEFFARHQVEVISSLPYYQEFFTDKQRGNGVFKKSVESLRLLNEQGYGRPNGAGLILNLVYNPAGAFLPASQETLERQFKKELEAKFGVAFNSLFTITNMPINRFRKDLERLGAYEDYMTRLVNGFNPSAARGVMCRSLISVGYDGRLYDCDFNQMLDLNLSEESGGTVFDFDPDKLLGRKIIFGQHCYGCAAGAGSSCGGVTAKE
ncbi:MAG TPA: arsenosugar biosynthesis radical SAM (seleno)protein ArsS [Blastocatellia bacterium]|nr:arsenosugar biosynthesis radical SAM (seleno)protein ArsS [Blastocatellia bacterium]